MYSYIIGIVTGYDKNSVILENNKIGYSINVGNPYSYKINEEYKIFLYNHIKEDENSLYGFKCLDEKELFLKLINVKGIGPKMALPLFAGNNISEIMNAINTDNVTYLTRFPKIGDKVAKQMVLDLKGKLNAINTGLFKKEDFSDELLEVLLGLGYKQADVKKVLSKVDANKSLEEQVKEALKLMLK